MFFLGDDQERCLAGHRFTRNRGGLHQKENPIGDLLGGTRPRGHPSSKNASANLLRAFWNNDHSSRQTDGSRGGSKVRGFGGISGERGDDIVILKKIAGLKAAGGAVRAGCPHQEVKRRRRPRRRGGVLKLTKGKYAEDGYFHWEAGLNKTLRIILGGGENKGKKVKKLRNNLDVPKE